MFSIHMSETHFFIPPPGVNLMPLIDFIKSGSMITSGHSPVQNCSRETGPRPQFSDTMKSVYFLDLAIFFGSIHAESAP